MEASLKREILEIRCTLNFAFYGAPVLQSGASALNTFPTLNLS